MTKQPKPKSLTESLATFLWERSAPPEILWHYTNGDGLIGIADGQMLWCSEYRHLNDVAEVSTFAVRMQAQLRDVLRHHLSADDVEKVVSGSDLYAGWNVYVCSFCSDADRNEHWHQYARKAGYALGFDPQTLKELAHKQGFSLAPVVYGEDKALEIAGTMIADNISVLERFKSPLSTEDTQALSSFYCRLILGCAPFFKPQSFERENEWRLVKVTGLEGDGDIQFRSSTTFGLLAYLKFRFRIDGDGKERRVGKPPAHLIPRVLIGPGNETATFIKASHVYHLLKRNGLETLVSVSASSLRF